MPDQNPRLRLLLKISERLAALETAVRDTRKDVADIKASLHNGGMSERLAVLERDTQYSVSSRRFWIAQAIQLGALLVGFTSILILTC